MVMRQSVASSASASSTLQSRDAEKKLDASTKAEMAVFESSGKRGRSLEQAYNYLMSVPPILRWKQNVLFRRLVSFARNCAIVWMILQLTLCVSCVLITRNIVLRP